MGLFSKLLNSIGGSAGRPCPDCGESLWADSGEPEGRYECHNDGCTGWRVYFDEGGVLVDPPNRGKTGGDSGSCEMCQSSLSEAVSYMPYEDGSNSHAYIKCSSCGQENVRYGFGEDD